MSTRTTELNYKTVSSKFKSMAGVFRMTFSQGDFCVLIL